jgi:hypothetical protein
MARLPDRWDIGPMLNAFPTSVTNGAAREALDAPMGSLVIRCRSCTPASTTELTEWLEDKLAQLRTGTPRLQVRLTRLVQDLPAATVDDGWLIEVQREGDAPGEGSGPLMDSLEEVLRDMRILGLDPTLLVPRRLPLGESALVSPGCAVAEEGGSHGC